MGVPPEVGCGLCSLRNGPRKGARATVEGVLAKTSQRMYSRDHARTLRDVEKEKEKESERE